jgi:hypothetical protein
MYTEGNPVNFTDPTGHLICPNGRDPKTGNCLPNPINALIGDLNLPPVLTEILRQPSISPQKAYIILIVFGVYCTVQLLNTDKISTWEDILSLPVQQPTPIPIPQFTSIPPIPYHTPQPTKTSRVELYRAVDSVELMVINTTGAYGYSPSGGGKYFAFAYAGAVKFAKDPFNAGKSMTITNIDVPEEFLTNGYIFNDTGSAGMSIHFSDGVLPALYYVMSSIRVLGSP